MLIRLKNRIKLQQKVNTFGCQSDAEKEYFVHTSNGTPVHIVRTRRKKTLTVKINGGDVSVLVPRDTSLSHIKAVVARKSDWIQQKLLQQESRTPVKHDYVEGEKFLYLGGEKTLKIVTGARKNIAINDSSIIVSSTTAPTPDNIKNRLKKWYQTQAQLYLARRTKHFAQIIGVKPRLINTRTYRARWGCCSNRKEITYNWQIIMAAESIIDYIIVHELCHIKEHNHSPDFWALVNDVMPDYKERKKWLDINGHIIHF